MLIQQPNQTPQTAVLTGTAADAARRTAGLGVRDRAELLVPVPTLDPIGFTTTRRRPHLE